MRGKHRTFSHLRVGAIGPGHVFDLRHRELAALMDPQEAEAERGRERGAVKAR
jgi:hypothetical protein